jgi:subtilisin-like proprotein convertase family protein
VWPLDDEHPHTPDPLEGARNMALAPWLAPRRKRPIRNARRVSAPPRRRPLGVEWLEARDVPAVLNFAPFDTPVAINDLSTVTSTINVPTPLTVADVNVRLNIAHTFDADLDVFLIHNGVRVELFTDVGGAGDDFTDTVLDDEAGIGIASGSAPFSGSFRPEALLAAFDGLSGQGTWTLEITDDAGIDTGTLIDWSLEISSMLPPPVTYTSAEVPAFIPDLGSVSSSLVVPDDFRIGDLDVTLSIDHPFIARDLIVTLVAPDGTQIDLVLEDFGVDGPFADTTLDDEAALELADGTAPFTGRFRPDGSLTNFDGLMSGGVWELFIQDVTPDFDGSLTDWSLAFTPIDSAPTYFSGDTPAFIPDSDGTNDGLLTSTVTVTDSFRVTDVDVTLNIEHEFIGDLLIFLAAPDDTIIQLVSDSLDPTTAFAGTVLTDEAAVFLDDVFDPPYSARYRPTEPLSSFDGLDALGEWTLFIFDTASGDVGTLDRWSLSFNNADLPANLRATSFTISPASVASGGTALVNYTIENAAAGFAGPFFVDLYLSTDNVIDESDVFLTSRFVNGLAPGATFSDFFFGPVSPDVGFPASGTVFLGLIIDSFDDVSGETDEADNSNRGLGIDYAQLTVAPPTTTDPTTPGKVSGPIIDSGGNLVPPAPPFQTYVSDTAVPVLDLTTVTSTIVVTDNFPIGDLDVFLDLDHTFDSDLDVFLIAPDGTRVLLFSGVGGSGENFAGTLLDDSAAVPIEAGQAPFQGSFRPTVPLSTLFGKSSLGGWTLEITDTAGLDVGTLNRWALILNPLLSNPRVDAVALSAPSGGVGDPLLVTFTVTNNGLLPTGPLAGQIVLSADPTPGQGGDLVLLPFTLDPLGVGETRSVTLPVILTGVPAGVLPTPFGTAAVFVGVVLDPGGTLREGIESDNAETVPFALVLPTAVLLPDPTLPDPDDGNTTTNQVPQLFTPTAAGATATPAAVSNPLLFTINSSATGTSGFAGTLSSVQVNAFTLTSIAVQSSGAGGGGGGGGGDAGTVQVTTDNDALAVNVEDKPIIDVEVQAADAVAMLTPGEGQSPLLPVPTLGEGTLTDRETGPGVVSDGDFGLFSPGARINAPPVAEPPPAAPRVPAESPTTPPAPGDRFRFNLDGATTVQAAPAAADDDALAGGEPVVGEARALAGARPWAYAAAAAVAVFFGQTLGFRRLTGGPARSARDRRDMV